MKIFVVSRIYFLINADLHRFTDSLRRFTPRYPTIYADLHRFTPGIYADLLEIYAHLRQFTLLFTLIYSIFTLIYAELPHYLRMVTAGN